jgi:hypothetical protein
MDKLTKLLARCKCGVHLTVNDHRNVYETAAQALEDLHDFAKDVPPNVLAKIIETDTLIDLHFYPDTSIGFYKVLHYDLDAALDEALAAVGAA